MSYESARKILTGRMTSGEPMRILIQKDPKGKLMESTRMLLRDSITDARGKMLDIRVSDRRTILPVPKLPGVEIIRVSNGDIATLLGEGAASFGITGEEQILDQRLPGVEIVTGLGMARSSLQVLAPKEGRIRSIEDLRGKSIVTPYRNLTEDFLERASIVPKSLTKMKTPEAGVAARVYDVAVDITATFLTALRNGLIPIYEIQKLEAVLAGQIEITK